MTQQRKCSSRWSVIENITSIYYSKLLAHVFVPYFFSLFILKELNFIVPSMLAN